MSKHVGQKKARPLVIAIGGAGLLLAAPAAALLANPGAAQAAPADDLFGCVLAPLGSDCLGADTAEQIIGRSRLCGTGIREQRRGRCS